MLRSARSAAGYGWGIRFEACPLVVMTLGGVFSGLFGGVLKGETAPSIGILSEAGARELGVSKREIVMGFLVAEGILGFSALLTGGGRDAALEPFLVSRALSSARRGLPLATTTPEESTKGVLGLLDERLWLLGGLRGGGGSGTDNSGTVWVSLRRFSVAEMTCLWELARGELTVTTGVFHCADETFIDTGLAAGIRLPGDPSVFRFRFRAAAPASLFLEV